MGRLLGDRFPAAEGPVFSLFPLGTTLLTPFLSVDPRRSRIHKQFTARSCLPGTFPLHHDAICFPKMQTSQLGSRFAACKAGRKYRDGLINFHLIRCFNGNFGALGRKWLFSRRRKGIRLDRRMNVDSRKESQVSRDLDMSWLADILGRPHIITQRSYQICKRTSPCAQHETASGPSHQLLCL